MYPAWYKQYPKIYRGEQKIDGRDQGTQGDIPERQRNAEECHGRTRA